MLREVHLILTYECNFSCDHCFWYCGPESEGVFTLDGLKQALSESRRVRTVQGVYFEGGEPFLYYPLMVEGIRIAGEMGLETGVVTNGYWARSIEDASLWLEPLRELGVSDLSVSDGSFHSGNGGRHAALAVEAARKMGIPARALRVERPSVEEVFDRGRGAVTRAITGDVLFRGRAADRVTAGLPHRPGDELTSCPHEELENPERVHIDPFGNVHLCQGLAMGNIRKTPLSDLLERYRPLSHPLCGPLVKGGPALLSKTYGMGSEGGFVDECHYCFVLRRALRGRFPEYLTPAHVYG